VSVCLASLPTYSAHVSASLVAGSRQLQREHRAPLSPLLSPPLSPPLLSLLLLSASIGS
jgi:hypothetical protein